MLPRTLQLWRCEAGCWQQQHQADITCRSVPDAAVLPAAAAAGTLMRACARKIGSATGWALLTALCCVRRAQSYAAPLLDILDPGRRLFAHRLFRDACLRVPSQHQPGVAFLMKDLSSLGRDLATTCIIDNTPTVRPHPL